jgi:CSLREA domain-containing protein
LTVTKTADTNDGACLPGNCSLRDAVIAANANPAADVIHVPAGHFTLTGASGEDAAASGDLDVTNDLTVVGAGSSSTIVDGAENDRLFDVFGNSTKLALTGMTLTGGNEPNGSAVNSVGAAIALEDVSVLNNVSGGGANTGFGTVHFAVPAAVNSSLTIDHSSFSGNTTGGGGSSGFGVINYIGQGLTNVTVSDSRFVGNRAGGDPGQSTGFGVIEVSNGTGGTMKFERSTFAGNAIGGGDGGGTGFGVLDLTPNGPAKVDITDSQFLGNTTGGGKGGGTGFGTLDWGGSSKGDLTVTRTTFGGNTVGGGAGGGTGFGGAIDMVTGATSTMNIVNSTFVGNSAGGGGGTGSGGALLFEPTTSGTATLTNVTLVGNRAGGAGGTGFGGGYDGPGAGTTSTMADTIVTGNFSNDAPSGCVGAVTSGGHNIEDGTTCAFTGTGDQKTGAAFGPLGDYGGLTQTLPPLPGNPAIDHGAGCTATDQRGQPRTGASCDVGAYEFAPPTATTGAATQVTETSAVLGGSLVPSLRAASFHFEYGKTTAYGSQTAAQSESGLAALGASAAISGLKPATTYHFRLVASGDATVAGQDATFKTPRVSLGKLRVSPRTFRAAPRGGSVARKRKTGTNISYAVSDASKTTFRILKPAPGRRVGKSCRKPSRRNRHGRKCTRLVSLGSFSHKDKAGKNKVHFTGRVHRHKLAPGKYRLRATPRANGVNGKARATGFRIVR